MVDLQEFSEREQEAQYQQIAQGEASKPFDLDQVPLWRFKLLRFAQEKHVLLMTIHHIIYDGWSHGVFAKELSVLYQDFSSGKPLSLPDLPLQYADFAYWQRQWLDGDVLRSQIIYWQQQLAGKLPVLKLPFDQPQSSQPISRATYRGDRQSVELSPHLTASLKALSDRQGVTLFIVLLGAFKLLLYQYTRQEDIIICSTQAGRNLSKIQGLIGFFNNITPVRTNLAENPSFLDLIDRIHRVVLDAYRYQDMPLQLLGEAQNLAHKRLYQVMFGLQNTPNQSLELPGLTVDWQDLPNGNANFDLFLAIEEKNEKLTALPGVMRYNSSN